MSNKAVFLDRDGVINEDNPQYTYTVEKFHILPGVLEALARLKSADYKLIVVTNQSGIAQGLYTREDVDKCHRYFQEQCSNAIDHYYYSPYHPSVTHSLGRKPGTLLFEKAIARFDIDPSTSWMIGDRGRDIIPARQLGMRTIQIGHEIEKENRADHAVMSLLEASRIILGH